jgi:TonB family protein
MFDLPVLEAPRLAGPNPETARMDPLAPVRIATKPAGFSGIDASTPEMSHGRLGATGSFGSPASAAPVLLARPAHLARGGFGDSIATVQPSTARQPIAVSRLAPVEILFKPRPLYTDEARRLRIEGEVLLEVLFAASGEVQVIRVLKGLGHGLDENAGAAARQMHFRPAQSENGPVDSSAVLQILFQLAY